MLNTDDAGDGQQPGRDAGGGGLDYDRGIFLKTNLTSGTTLPSLH